MKSIRLALPANLCAASCQRANTTAANPGISRLLTDHAAWKFVAAATVFCLMALAASAFALELAWNRNPEPDITGYELSYGTTSGSYTTTLTTGTTPSATLTGLLPDTRYYFVVRAINSTGLKSAASQEVAHQTAAVTPDNSAPVAAGSTLQTKQDTPVSIVLAASDADDDPLTYEIVSPPASGTLSGTAPSLLYTPAPGFSGNDVLTFRAHDGIAFSAPATVSIRVLPVSTGGGNRPPVFRSNPIMAPAAKEGRAYGGVSLASRVADPDPGDTLRFLKLSGPAWLKVSSSGLLTGTPPAGSTGRQRFVIRVSDRLGSSAEAALLIEVGRSTLPLPWNAAEIGWVKNRTLVAYSKGTFSLQAPGRLAEIGDAGAFACQTLSGDGEIIARIGSVAKG